MRRRHSRCISRAATGPLGECVSFPLFLRVYTAYPSAAIRFTKDIEPSRGSVESLPLVLRASRRAPRYCTPIGRSRGRGKMDTQSIEGHIVQLPINNRGRETLSPSASTSAPDTSPTDYARPSKAKALDRDTVLPDSYAIECTGNPSQTTRIIGKHMLYSI